MRIHRIDNPSVENPLFIRPYGMIRPVAGQPEELIFVLARNALKLVDKQRSIRGASARSRSAPIGARIRSFLMPDAIQAITYLNPIRYFLVVLREIYLKATPLKYLLPETGAMALFGVVIFSAAVLRFRRKLR